MSPLRMVGALSERRPRNGITHGKLLLWRFVTRTSDLRATVMVLAGRTNRDGRAPWRLDELSSGRRDAHLPDRVVYYQRKWTKTRPKLFESFSTRW